MWAEAATPVRASDFVATIGVNTHLSWVDTPYWDLARISSALDYLGVSNLRDVITPWSETRVDALISQGYDFCFLVGTHDLAYQLAAFEARVEGVRYVEGPNETDNWPVTFDGLTGLDATEAMMRYLRTWIDESAVLGDATADIPLLQTTFGHTAIATLPIDLLGTADIANAHSYAPWGWNPGLVLEDRIDAAALIAPSGRVVSTEAGYHTALDCPWWTGVSEQVQAAYTMTLLFEQFNLGVEATYLYSLLESSTAPSSADADGNFGLFRADGTPKPAAQAISRTTDLLRSDGDFQLAPLDLEVSGLPATADQLLMQTGANRYVLVVWNDLLLWDDRTDTALTPASVPIQLSLGAAARLRVVDSVTGAAWTVEPVNGVATLALPPRPLLVEIVTQGAGTVGQAPSEGGALTGTDAGETITGGGAADQISGLGGDDVLLGLAGRDVLEGGAGVDRLEGGLGDDVYILGLSADDAGDLLVEASGGGLDEVRSRMSLTLAAEIENLALLGTEALAGTGNGADNRIEGNEGDNRLSGLGGRDHLLGGGGRDVLDGGAGQDVLEGGAGDDTYLLAGDGDGVVELAGGGVDQVIAAADCTLAEEVENLTLTGTLALDGRGNSSANRIVGNDGANRLEGLAGADTLRGGGGDDRLDGGAGDDRLEGGAGDDVYVVDSAQDVVVEAKGAGVDEVRSSVGIATLFADVENVTLLGSAAIDASGNLLANRLTGNAGANVLGGGAGGDTLLGAEGDDRLMGGGGRDRIEGGVGSDLVEGGAEADSLSGGLGDDVFHFAAPRHGSDVITDFHNLAGDNDSIQISATSFGGGLVAGMDLSASQFRVANGTTLWSKSDLDVRFIWEADDTRLWYDSNGSARGGLVLLADLQAGAVVGAADILIV